MSVLGLGLGLGLGSVIALVLHSCLTLLVSKKQGNLLDGDLNTHFSVSLSFLEIFISFLEIFILKHDYNVPVFFFYFLHHFNLISFHNFVSLSY